MRIGLQTWGSEGDVRPMAALAAGLAAAGHDVTLVVTEVAERDYSELADRHGFRLIHAGSPVLKSATEIDTLGRDMLIARHPALQAKLLLHRAFFPEISAMRDAAVALCETSDVVIGHFFLYPLRAAADRAGVPWLSFHPGHCYIESRFTRAPGMPDWGQWFHPVAWSLARWGTNRLMLANVNRTRRAFGLTAFRDVLRESWVSEHLNLIGVAPEVFGRPADWPASHVVTGFLGFSAAQSADGVASDVEAFLSSGAPPVYFGFGSLIPGDPAAIRELVATWRDAARRAGCRAILQVPTGAADGGDSDDRILIVSRGNHAALFPRCAAIVHHGGAGTTHAVLAAGRPSVVVPHLADQYFWAAELRRLGVAGSPVSRFPFRSTRLAAAIRAATEDSRMQDRAREAADRMRGASGVDRAVDAVHDWMRCAGIL